MPYVPDIQVQSCAVFHAIPGSQFLAVSPALAEKLDLTYELLRVYNHDQFATEINRKGVVQWQGQWDGTEKAACRSFFPVLDRRLKMKIPVTPEFTAIVTGHGKTRSYPHRFKMIDNPTCTCNEGHQTPDHLIYECKLLLAQRSSLIKHIMIRGGVWPSTHNELVTTYLNAFAKFIKAIDFQKLQ